MIILEKGMRIMTMLKIFRFALYCWVKELNQSLHSVYTSFFCFVNSASINKEKEPVRSNPTSNKLVWMWISHIGVGQSHLWGSNLREGVLYWPYIKRLSIHHSLELPGSSSSYLTFLPKKLIKSESNWYLSHYPKEKANANEPFDKHIYHRQWEYLPSDKNEEYTYLFRQLILSSLPTNRGYYFKTD